VTSRAGQLSSLLTTTPLHGFRNLIINGNFDIWQRGTSQSAGGYGSADRWLFYFGTGSGVVSRQAFDLGQSDVPGNPRFFCRHVVSTLSAAGIGTALGQRIEDVRTLAGRTATLTFYARAENEQMIAARAVQDFGTGGSPSAVVETPVASFNVGPNWQKCTATVNIPSIAGKTLGDANDHLRIDIGRPAADTVGGYLDVARVSLVEGDATAEVDPFAPRHISQEMAMCRRYLYRIEAINQPYMIFGGCGYAESATYAMIPVSFPALMRADPGVSISAVGDFVLRRPGNVIVPITSVAINVSNRYGALLGVNVASGLTVGEPLFLHANNNTSASLLFSAEL